MRLFGWGDRDSKNMRDTGSMGENYFSQLCADAGLTANPSSKDKFGWDFIVDFPQSNDFSPMLLHNSALTFRVQVKSTDQRFKKIQVNLSNLHRMAADLVPYFFVFIEFDRQPNAQRLFLVHMGEELISKVLSRVHKIHQSSEENNLHKKAW